VHRLAIMRRSTVVLVPSVLALLLVGGCGSGGGQPSSPPAANNPSADNPPATGQAAAGKPAILEAHCDVAPASLVKSTLGLAVGDPEETHVVRSLALCQYKGSAGGATLTIDIDGSTETFAQRRTSLGGGGQAIQELAGFQDEAFTAKMDSLGVTYNTLAARKGKVELQVTSSASVDQTKAFAAAVFAKLV
jgi:hypothetical protein